MHIPKRVRLFFMGSGQRSVEILIGTFVVVFLLFYRLGSLVPGFSPGETATIQSASEIDTIITNPLFGPYKLLLLAVEKTGFTSPLAFRSVSALLALLCIGIVYYILKRWYTTRVSIIGTLLFATSTWFLVQARQATPDISYVLVVLLLAYGTWMRRTKRAGNALFLGVCIGAALLYIPGLIWLLLFGALWQRKHIFHLFKDAPRLGVLCIILFILLIAPLVLGLMSHAALARSALGLNIITQLTPASFLHNITEQFNVLFLGGPTNPSQGLIGSALVDPFIFVMAVLGGYALIHQRKLDRSWMLAGGTLIAIVLLGLGGLTSNIILMPFVYIVGLAGIALMIQQWFTVFPRNPLARVAGFSIITAAVLLSGYYNLDRYFRAWPSSHATKRLYSIKTDQ